MALLCVTIVICVEPIVENYSLATDSEKQLLGGVLLWDGDEIDR